MVPQWRTERQLCENLGDHGLEVFVDLLGLVVLLDCGAQIRIRNNISINQDKVVIQLN